MKTLWLITARAGSLSIPNKNIRSLGGHPLLAFRAKSTQKYFGKNDLWISTDSEKYAEIASGYGVHVPFIRPQELATDMARSSDVVLHALEWAKKKGLQYDTIGLIEPTSPFIYPETLREAHEKLSSSREADAIVATREVRPSTFYVQEENLYLNVLAERMQEEGSKRRQEEKTEITPSGGFYLSRIEAFLKHGTFYSEKTLSHTVSHYESLEIDEPIDWDWAEFLLSSGKVNLSDFGL